MSRFDDEQQPGPALEGDREPRLLTRPAPPEDPFRRRRAQPAPHKQHTPEQGLRAWAQRLRNRRERVALTATAAPEADTPELDDPEAVAPEIDPRTSAPLSPAQRHRRRLLAWAVGGTTLLLLITALVAILDLRHALTASLPQLDGDLRAPGLHAPVTVTRNAQGVPNISAGSLHDLLFAEGFVTASDRLWQMDGLRRHAAGELAEVLGAGLVEHDRRQRYLQIRAAADRGIAALPPDQLAELQAYADGVNAFLATHGSSLPVEFRLLAYRPAPWVPRDSLLVSLAMFQDLSTQFPQKLNREILSAHLPSTLLPDLYPVGSWRDLPPAAEDRNLSAPHEVEQIPLDPSQAQVAPATANPADLLAVSAALGTSGRCEGCRPGSNNWAVSGTHTASGKPLLSNDMHLNLGIPDIWYEAGLHSAGTDAAEQLDVTGFTLPGVPFVIVGRNAHVAWGVTNLGGDVQDLLVEHLRGSGNNTEYQRADGAWERLNHHPEHIRVRGGRDVVVDVQTTTHAVGTTMMETPIISPLYRSERRALALAWTAYDPANLTSPFLAVDQAADGTSLIASLASFGGPTLNLVWADDGGHIGYHAIGRIPVRGPAVQHPKSVPTANPEAPAPQGIPLPAEDDNGEGEPGPEARLTLAAPRWVLSSFSPVRRARARARTPAPAPPAPRRGGRRRVLVQRQPIPVAPSPPEQAVIPARPATNFTVGSPISPLPVDALDAGNAWSGYIGYGDLPAVTDPPNGVLATANSRITPDDYPYAVANDWADAFRTDRILQLLHGRRGLTAEDMLGIENDVHSDVNRLEALRFAYAVDHASTTALGSERRRLRQAADLLRSWDGSMAAGSPAAAIFSAVHAVLWPALLVPQMQAHDGRRIPPQTARQLLSLYTWGERNSAAEVLLQNQPARWLPHDAANWNDFLTGVLRRGLASGNAPDDLTHWAYGQLHTVEIAHPIFGDHHLLSALLGITGTTGPEPAPGDPTTIKQIGAHFGPSERFTADLSSPENTLANLTTGQSGNGRSPFFLDQFHAWLRGTSFALPLHVETAEHTLHLLPGGTS